MAPVITPDDIEHLGARVVSSLASLATPGGWSRKQVPGLTWDARMVVDHLCNTLAFYANHAALDAGEKMPRIRSLGDDELSDADLARSLSGWVAVLSAVLRVKTPESRGWHTLGMTDPEGFAALACNELAIHCDDVHRAHERSFSIDESLSMRLLRRLFPDVDEPPSVPPSELLRWANGRCALRDRPRRERWQSHPSPLAR